MSVAGSAAQASTLVVSDSGTVAQFTMTNEGISAGVATILYVGEPNAQSFINNVNGVTVPQEATTVNGPVTFTVQLTSPHTYTAALVPPTYQEMVGSTVGSQAIMAFNQTAAFTSPAPAFLNSTGMVTSLLANANPTYDFSNFANGKGTINFTFTATTFGGGVSSFDQLFATVGGTATGTGSFSQISNAIPEPASLGLMGIGMSGLFALRRFLKRAHA
jgi:hypothetical protein